MSNNEQSIEEMGRWINDNRAAYNEGIQKLSDSDWVRNMLRVLRQQLDDVLMFNPLNHDPHVAVFAAGRIQARTENLFADIDLLDQWEEEKERYDEAVAKINSEEESAPDLG